MTPVEEAIAALEKALGYLHWYEGESASHAKGRKQIEAQVSQALSRLRDDGEGWRPIEEAPREHCKNVLLWWPPMREPLIGWWHNGEQEWRSGKWPAKPTVFRPLPDPPK